MRVRALAASLLLLAAGVVAEIVLHDETELPRGLVLLAPGRRFRAWGYEMDAQELHVGHGVWTQVRTVVPLGRIEHLDISQGPLERGFSVCRLILHTAGTQHSQVTVPGLSRETAERMRDEIRARIRQEPE
jgi:hypothetical protein